MDPQLATLIVNSVVTVAMAIIGLITLIVTVKNKNRADSNAAASAAADKSQHDHLEKQDVAQAATHALVQQIAAASPVVVLEVDKGKT